MTFQANINYKELSMPALEIDKWAFRSGRSCIEQIFVLRQVIEQLLEYQQRISLNIIDFDSMLWKIARAYGIPSPFVEIFCNLNQCSYCCVRMEEGVTYFFMIKTGVRQGCILLPMLSLFIIDFNARYSIDHLHIGIPWTVGNFFLSIIVILGPKLPYKISLWP